MKRRLVKVVVLLAVGAVVNVAVAWWMLARSDAPAVIASGWGSWTVAGSRSLWPGGTPEAWPAPDAATCWRRRGVQVAVHSVNVPPSGPSARMVRSTGVRHESEAGVAAVFRDLALYGGAERLSAAEVRCGWPWLSLSAVRWGVHSGGLLPPARTMIPRHSWWGTGVPASKASGTAMLRLPIRPVIGGFVGNTVVFALLAWLVGRAPGWVLRRFRRRCGLCLACGYPVGAAPVCAECGGPVKARPIRPARRAGRPLAGWLMAAGIIAAVYAMTVWWGVCFKSQSGWYGGVWAGRIAVGYSQERFMAPGVEVGHFAIPFGLSYQRHEDRARTLVLVPIWWVLAILLPWLGSVWWRYAVYRTIGGREVAGVCQAAARRNLRELE